MTLSWYLYAFFASVVFEFWMESALAGVLLWFLLCWFAEVKR